MAKLIDNLMIGYDTQDLEQMTGIEGARFAFLAIDPDGRCNWLDMDRREYSFALDNNYSDIPTAEQAMREYLESVADEPWSGLDFTGATEDNR